MNTTLDKKFADVTQKLEEANTAIESANGEIAKKQDKLSFDKQPTAESVNPVESSGIKSYVDTYATQAAQDAVDRILDIDDAAVETLWSESA